MAVQQLRRIHDTKPFRPYSLKLADGTKLRVKSPEFLWILPSGRTVHVATGEDDFEIVDLLLVTAIEVSNGQARSSKRT